MWDTEIQDTGHLKTEVGDGVTRPQAKDSQAPQEAQRSKEALTKVCGSTSVLLQISDICNQFLVF